MPQFHSDGQSAAAMSDVPEQCIPSFKQGLSRVEKTLMKESCIQFPTKPPCSTRVDVLETGEVPILFSLPQMNCFETTVELDPKGD